MMDLKHEKEERRRVLNTPRAFKHELKSSQLPIKFLSQSLKKLREP